MSTTDLPGSSLLAGRYRLVERLGAGGMSVVWRGFDEVLGRQVAVKVLPPSTSADPSFRRRLRLEAQAAARLSHPHITNVYDYGEAVTVDGEPVPYVVMELVDGESLAAALAQQRRLPWPVAVRVCSEVSAALAAAHARGIVHRDVTPANVMLTPTGAKVVDFGISALIGENDIDPDGSLLGTPAYLAPERLEGGQVSPATDVYAVGLLLYRTLIGQLPWDVGTTTALLRAHQYIEPDPMPHVAGMPAAVRELVDRCLDKRPADRPSGAELARVLAALAAGAPSVRSYGRDLPGGAEDTTILPTRDADGGGRVRPGHAPPAGAGPARAGRGVAAVSPVAARGAAAVPGVPVSPAPVGGIPVSPAPAGVPVPAGAAAFAGAAAGGDARVRTPAPRAGAARSGPVPSGPVGPGAPAGAPPGRDGGDPPAAPLRPAVGGAAADPPGAADATRPPGGRGPAPAHPRPSRTAGVGRRRVAVVTAALAAFSAVYAASLLIDQSGPAAPAAAPRQPGAVVPAAAGGACVVTYNVTADDGRRFRATVQLANRGAAPVRNWKLWFLANGQTLSGNGKTRLQQSGPDVTVGSATTLPAMQTVEFSLTGRYEGVNKPPMVFKLGGRTCEAYISARPGAPSQPVQQPAGGGQATLGPALPPGTRLPGISVDEKGVAHADPTQSAAPSTSPTSRGPVAPKPPGTTLPTTGVSTSTTPSPSASTTTSLDPGPGNPGDNDGEINESGDTLGGT